jgi:uncharacterized membrane protein
MSFAMSVPANGNETARQSKRHSTCFANCVVKRIYFKRRVMMSEENSTGNNLIWAVTLIIIVAIIAGALFYSRDFLRGPKQQKIDVEISTPAR